MESLSLASSVDAQEDETPRVGSSHPIPQSSDFPPEGRAQENLDTVESPRGHSIFRKWLPKKTERGPMSPKPGRLSGKSREAADSLIRNHQCHTGTFMDGCRST